VNPKSCSHVEGTRRARLGTPECGAEPPARTMVRDDRTGLPNGTSGASTYPAIWDWWVGADRGGWTLRQAMTTTRTRSIGCATAGRRPILVAMNFLARSAPATSWRFWRLKPPKPTASVR